MSNAVWQVKQLGDLCEILDHKRKPITKSDRVAGPYPYYGATCIQDYVANYLFDEPLVLVGEDGAKWGSGDATAFPVDGKVWVNNHAHVLRPRRSILLDNWLIHYLNHSDLSEYVSGVTVPKLNQGNLRQIPIPLPPLPEQQRIVGILDEAVAAIATAKANTEKNLTNARGLIAAASEELLLSVIESTRTHSLRELIDRGIIMLGRGKVISKRDLAAYPGDYPVYSSAKENNGEFGRYGLFMFDEEMITWSVDGGGRLFHRPRHRFSVTNVGGTMRILDESVLRYGFLFRVLTTLHAKIPFDWVLKAHPSVIEKLYDKIPLPPMELQKSIETKLGEVEQQSRLLVEAFSRKLAALDALKKSLLHQAFSGQLTGTTRANVASKMLAGGSA